MSIYYQDDFVALHHGDCLDVLAAMPDNSVDSIVTDPPYGLSNTTPAQVAETITHWVSGDREYLPTGRGFMGKEWDGFVPPVAVWDECLRVLKPGGHMAVFAGSRTHDLMTLSIRFAGFEIRDSLAWLYGSGFPKSMDVSKAIDKGQGKNRQRQLEFTEWMRSTGITVKQISEATGTATMGGHYLDTSSQPAIATADLFDKLRPLLPEVPERIERLVAERTGIEWKDYIKREVVGVRKTGIGTGKGGTAFIGDSDNRDITAPATSEAAKWDGWGTALKPGHEPVVLARKPLEGTVARNVLEHGTGAINVDACRIAGESTRRTNTAEMGYHGGNLASTYQTGSDAGRWPANVLLDEHAAAWVDEQSGISILKASESRGVLGGIFRLGGCHTEAELRALAEAGEKTPNGETATRVLARYEASEDRPRGHTDSGGASRFFYTAKAPKSERPVVEGEDGTKIQHPTVKPLAIMRWLIRLITPPGGTVLDPFAGSGTTIEAAMIEGFHPVGIEKETDYLPLITARIARAQTSAQGVLDLGGIA